MLSKKAVVFALTLFVSFPQFATAQLKPIPSVGVKLGDDVERVKTILKTNLDPEPMARKSAFDTNAGKTVLHLRTKGIWVFFDRSGVAETIRLDAPFSGDVLGVKLGESEAVLIRELGKPIGDPYPAFITLQAYRYALDDTAYVVFDVGDDGVKYILITK